MIEFKTRLDVNCQKALNKMNMKKALVILLIFSFVLICLGVFGIFVMEDGYDLTSSVTLIVFGIAFTPLVALVSAISQKNIMKANPFLKYETKEIYRFTDEGLEILQKREDNYYAKVQAGYSYIMRAISTKEYYFLYTESNRCHVINKSHITQGSVEELDALFVRKLPMGKFKVKSK